MPNTSATATHAQGGWRHHVPPLFRLECLARGAQDIDYLALVGTVARKEL